MSVRRDVNPAPFFVVPVLMTLALVLWWLWALTHPMHFPGHQPHPGPNSGVVAFNLLLAAIVVVAWAAAYGLWTWRCEQKAREK